MVLQIELAGLDLGEVEDVVDHGQEGIGRGFDRIEQFVLFIVLTSRKSQPAHADDGIHRRPDLMGHIGEEQTFRLVRFLRPIPCLPDFCHRHLDCVGHLIESPGQLTEFVAACHLEPAVQFARLKELDPADDRRNFAGECRCHPDGNENNENHHDRGRQG